MKRKLVAALLVVALSLTAVTSCSKSHSNASNKPTIEISEDTPWYTYELFDPAAEFAGWNYNNSSPIKSDSEGITFLTYGVETFRDSELIKDNFTIVLNRFAFDGEEVFNINLSKTIDEFYDFDIVYEGIYDSIVYFTGVGYNEDYDGTKYCLTIDSITGQISGWIPAKEFDKSFVSRVSPSDSSAYFEKCYTLGDYKIYSYYTVPFGTAVLNYIIEVEDPNGNVTEFIMDDVIPDVSYNSIDAIMMSDETTLVLALNAPAKDNSYHNVEHYYAEIDLNSMVAGNQTEKYSWLNDIHIKDAIYVEGRGTYTCDPIDGVGLIDFNNQQITNIMGTHNCLINSSQFANLSINYMDDQMIVMTGMFEEPTIGWVVASSKMLILTRCDSNPNVGKEIITVASLDGYSYPICETIKDFNSTSTTAFAIIDPRYTPAELSEDDYSTNDEYLAALASQKNEIGKQLAIDIFAGDGPDIIFGANNLTMLNNSDYLVELSDITDSLSSDEYFTNIFNLSKDKNGNLYQLPLSYDINVIETYSSNIKDGQVGFTYAEYEEFVSDICNGKNPLALGHYDYFNLLFGSMYDDFIDGGNINLSGKEFEALTNHVKDNAKIKTFPNYDFSINTCTEKFGDAGYGNANNIANYICSYGSRSDSISLLGIPTFDGRGPEFSITNSVAIASNANDIEDCKAFINALLNTNNQTNICLSRHTNPVNVEALYTFGNYILDYYNTTAQNTIDGYNWGDDMWNTILTSSVIDDYADTIRSLVGCYRLNPALAIIIYEDIQAYYADQKTLNEVVDIMSNRITTYINENT